MKISTNSKRKIKMEKRGKTIIFVRLGTKKKKKKVVKQDKTSLNYGLFRECQEIT